MARITAFMLGDTRSDEEKAQGVSLIESSFGTSVVSAGSFVARGPILAAEFEECEVECLRPGHYNVFVLTADFLGTLGGLRATHLLIVHGSSHQGEVAMTTDTVRQWVKNQEWQEIGGIGVDGGTAGFFDSAAPELYGLTLSQLRGMLTTAKFETIPEFEPNSTLTMDVTYPIPRHPSKGIGRGRGRGRGKGPMHQPPASPYPTSPMHQLPATPYPTSPVVLPKVTRMVGRQLFATCSNLGVICSAGFGDGGYPVFVNSNGSAAILEFIGADILKDSNFALAKDPGANEETSENEDEEEFVHGKRQKLMSEYLDFLNEQR
eukprot:TRINITY_DN10914_c0_g3_i1.p1 TRINITY_DN10914_c0_g3~~TRINITY_DN10914_c0_g3_i1.p1  ORF type:complete len:361 (-),score=54.24 TRINITY_DN10914_c0_g3_i1:272-1231(-)